MPFHAPSTILGAGSALFDFGRGAGRVDDVSVVVTGQGSIQSSSVAQAFLMGDATSDNDADAHAIAGSLAHLVCRGIVPGVGFTITALGDGITGRFLVRWNWI